nr:hypothetical protein [Salmonid herpesvirus 1]
MKYSLGRLTVDEQKIHIRDNVLPEVPLFLRGLLEVSFSPPVSPVPIRKFRKRPLAVDPPPPVEEVDYSSSCQSDTSETCSLSPTRPPYVPCTSAQDPWYLSPMEEIPLGPSLGERPWEELLTPLPELLSELSGDCDTSDEDKPPPFKRPLVPNAPLQWEQQDDDEVVVEAVKKRRVKKKRYTKLVRDCHQLATVLKKAHVITRPRLPSEGHQRASSTNPTVASGTEVGNLWASCGSLAEVGPRWLPGKLAGLERVLMGLRFIHDMGYHHGSVGKSIKMTNSGVIQLGHLESVSKGASLGEVAKDIVATAEYFMDIFPGASQNVNDFDYLWFTLTRMQSGQINNATHALKSPCFCC